MSTLRSVEYSHVDLVSLFLFLSLALWLVLSPLFMYLIICLNLYRCSLPASFVCRQRCHDHSVLASTYETGRESVDGEG